MSAPFGNKNTLGKHWKVKDTSKMCHKRTTPIWNKGKKMSEKQKENMFHKGMLGKHHSKETIEKMKKRMLGKYEGKNHPQWLGGKSFEPYSVDWTETLKRSIRERNNYICQLCSQYGNNVHHIDYDKKNCNPDNLITLCKICNIKVNKNRNYWTNYFQCL